MAAIVAAMRNGDIRLEEVCRHYELSVDEFLAWPNARLRPMACQVCAPPACRSAATPPLQNRAGAQRGAMMLGLVNFNNRVQGKT
jgi:hypothetical protein